MSTLYELTGDWFRIQEYIDDPDMDEDIILETWEQIDEDIELKAEGYAKLMRNIDQRVDEINGLIKPYKDEIDRLSQKAKSLTNRQERLKKALQSAMTLTGKTKFKTDLFSFGIQKNPPSVVIDDPDSIPLDYLIPQPPKVDTAELKKWLKDNEADFAHLEQGESLRIR